MKFSDLESRMRLFETFYRKPVHHELRVPKTRWVVLRSAIPGSTDAPMRYRRVPPIC